MEQQWSVSEQGKKGQTNEVIIDLESDELSFAQAHQIRLKIEKDVLQLQNRVRMLQDEEMRAIKKVNETRYKTQQIKQIMEKNEADLKQRQINHQKQKQDEDLSRQSLLESKAQSQKEFRIRVTELNSIKIGAVTDLKQKSAQSKKEIEIARQALLIAAKERKLKIEFEKKSGAAKREEIKRQKQTYARGDVEEQGQLIQSQISLFEKEAKELERLETELLKKLQDTQRSEREAFMKLESAMIDSSQPIQKRNRDLSIENSVSTKNKNSQRMFAKNGPEEISVAKSR